VRCGDLESVFSIFLPCPRCVSSMDRCAMPPTPAAADALIINLWGLQAAASGLPAIIALSGLVLVLILTKRFRWW
jgi:hypothetical protein